MTTKKIVQVEGKELQLSNLDKVLWPKAGVTKANLLEYHARLFPLTKRHWQGRALIVTRYPHGIEGEFFFQKNIPASAPPWVQTAKIEDTNYVVANDLATVSWLANLAAIEFHPSTYLAARAGVPSYAIIDLDPTEPQGYAETVDAARHCRDVLCEIGLQGYPKLSGATGIHIYIPLQARYNFQITAQLVKFIGMTLQRRYPEKFTLERLVKKRHGVYVDYLQNHPSRTIVGVYSPRPTLEATVSTPIRWEDLSYYEPRDFTVHTVPEWIKGRGDLFEQVFSQPQSLERLQNPEIFQK